MPALAELAPVLDGPALLLLDRHARHGTIAGHLALLAEIHRER